MHVIIFTGGRVRDGGMLRKALASADEVMAADSGAERALALGVTPSLVIGDFDSLDPSVRTKLETDGVEIVRHPARKDSTDTELALDHAAVKGARLITLVGGTDGDRLDHVLANVFTAAGHDVTVRLVDGDVQAWAERGPHTAAIAGAKGDRVSLIPLSHEVTGIRTEGLGYPLAGGTLSMTHSRGVSNVMTRKQAAVAWHEGLLLLVHSAHPK